MPRSGKTDEVVLLGGSAHTIVTAGGNDLIRHGFAVPPSPEGEGFWSRHQQFDKSEFIFPALPNRLRPAIMVSSYAGGKTMTDRLYDLAALDMDGTLLNSAHEI